jgi:hypothetical protein
MAEFFPQGFWFNATVVGMVVFLVFGVDLLFGARLVMGLSRVLNKSFHVDQVLIHALEGLKKTSDRAFDVESHLLQGWGRFVVGGLLIFGAGMLMMNLLPNLK